MSKQIRFSVSDIEILLPLFRIETLKKGDYFVRETNSCAKIGFVMTGVFKTFYSNSSEEVIRYLSKEQQWAGHFESFMNQKNSPESVQALSDGQLATITYYSYQNLTQEKANWHEIWATIIDNAEKERYENKHLQFSDFKQRYEQFIQQHPDLAIQMPLEDIAVYLKIPYQSLLNILYDTVIFS